jgi:hypothetical protein
MRSSHHHGFHFTPAATAASVAFVNDGTLAPAEFKTSAARFPPEVQKAFGRPASLRIPLAVNFDFSFRSTATRIPVRGFHQIS